MNAFVNKSKPPIQFTFAELKAEVMARMQADPKMDPKFVTLAEHCILNTAYVHNVRESQAVKRWDTSVVTLMGDSVFK